jgi:tRNA(fMet)-specific endonuclease VapC
LKSKRATAQLVAFELFCSSNVVLPLTDEIVIRASDIYADLKQKGLLVGDADILIAASALAQGCAVVTNNEKHFCRIPNLQILNWLRV